MQNKKTHSKRFFVMLLVFGAILGGAGQFLFKYALASNGIYLAAFLLIGLAAYGIATLTYFYALGRSHLSWAYGFGGISYIVASILASTSLGEAISPIRWIGILIIAIGTAVIGSS